MTTMRTRSAALAAAAVLMLAPLTGCGGDEKKASSDPTGSSAPTGTPAPSAAAVGTRVSVDDFVARLTGAMDHQKSVHMSIDGGGALQLEADVEYAGTPAIELHTTFAGSKLTMVIVDGTLYLQQAGGKFTKIAKDDPTYGRLLGSFEDFGPRRSIKDLKAAITKVVKIGNVSLDGDDLTQYDLTADSTKIGGAFQQLAGSVGVAKSVTLSFFLDSADLIRQIGIDAAGQKVMMKFSDWGKPVDIKAPTASQMAPSVNS